MKIKSIALILLLIICGLNTQALAKKQPVVQPIYVFGFAASFSDTIVHFTPIQQLDSASVSSKFGFLKNREDYSYQLRDYLDSKEKMPHRTCVVFYDKKRENLEKKYSKMKKLYTKSKDGKAHFDVRYIADDAFRFTVIKNNDE